MVGLNKVKIEEYVFKRPNTTVAEIQFVFKLKYSEARALVQSMVDRDVLAYRGGTTYENLLYNDDVWGVRKDKKDDWETRDESNDIDFDCCKDIDEALSYLKKFAVEPLSDDESDRQSVDNTSRTTVSAKKSAKRKKEQTDDPFAGAFGYRVENGRLVVCTDCRYPNGGKYLIEKTECDGEPYFSDSGKTLDYICEKFGVPLDVAVKKVASRMIAWNMASDDTSLSKITVDGNVLWCKISSMQGAQSAFDFFATVIKTVAELNFL